MAGGWDGFNRRAAAISLHLSVVLVLGVAGCGGTRSVSAPIPPPPSPPSASRPASVPPSQPIGSARGANPPAAFQPVVPPSALAPAPTYAEQGIASWYGAPFDGRRASDGEIYDMRQPVAAHRTLPFGSIVRVTNLNNGLQTEVRIIDRGPFVAGRIIDLSLEAARALNLVGPGTAPVLIELVSSPAALAGNFTVQVGAFAIRANAERLRAQLLTQYMPIFIQESDAPNGHFFRVRVGREPSPDAAQKLASTLSGANGLQTFVVRLDDTQCCSAGTPANSPVPAPVPGGPLP